MRYGPYHTDRLLLLMLLMLFQPPALMMTPRDFFRVIF
jgi:hypothetical protein